MADASPPLMFNTGFVPETGNFVQVMPGVGRVTAPNSGPYTFTGTNSFVIGHDSVALLDPGPIHNSHMEALRTAIGGRTLEAILLTHTHKDHSASAAAWRKETGAPLWFAGPHRRPRMGAPGRGRPLNGAAPGRAGPVNGAAAGRGWSRRW